MLLGRARELESIDALLGDVRAGRGRGLLVTGEAGMRKTSPLDAARERAEGFLVIAAIGIEAEADRGLWSETSSQRTSCAATPADERATRA